MLCAGVCPTLEVCQCAGISLGPLDASRLELLSVRDDRNHGN